jgi:hypothetical protein
MAAHNHQSGTATFYFPTYPRSSVFGGALRAKVSEAYSDGKKTENQIEACEHKNMPDPKKHL